MKKLFVLGAASILFLTAQAQKVATTPFGKGINFMAQDSSMTMKLQYRMQNLFVVEQQGDNVETTAQLRRSRLKFSGYAFSPKLQYKAELGLSSRDISTGSEDGRTGGSSRIVLDAVLKYEFVKGWQVWVGQTKLPGNRERVVSSADLQFVDRSRVNSRFNIDRDMGVQLHGKVALGGMVLKPKFAFSMGEGRSVSSENVGGFCYTTRLDFLPLGEFEGKKDDYILSDLKRQSTPKIALGATYNVNDRAVRQQGQLGRYVTTTNADGEEIYVENTLQYFGADMLFKYKGISSLIEYANTTGEKGIGGFRTGNGFSAQLGYLFKNNFEVAGRFAGITGTGTGSKLSAEDHYTLGLSKYIVGHKLKIQSDATLIQTPGNDDTMMYRLQFEMQL